MTDSESMPKHIAIIMDGNGRWAKRQNKSRSQGHKKGVDRVINIVEYCRKLNLPYLSLYAFSTENWKRPQEEVSFIMKLLVSYIDHELSRLIENGVRVHVLGDYKVLPLPAKLAVEKAIRSTKDNNDMVLNIALNYGGRDEILRATKRIAGLVVDGKLDIDEINEETISANLYTSGQPDPDLVIRPGCEKRLSNFLTYQTVYSELYFTNVMWPDFTNEELDKAIEDYKNRKRRYGGL